MEQIKYPYWPICKITDPAIIALNQAHWECVDRVRELDRVYVSVSLFCLGQCLHANLIEPGEIGDLIHDVQIDFENKIIHARKSLSFEQLHPAVTHYLEQYKDSIEEFHEEKRKLRSLKNQVKAKLIESKYFADQLFLDRTNTLMVNIEGSIAEYKKRVDQQQQGSKA